MQACNQRSFKINTAESAQPRNRSIVTRPFSSWEGGVWAWDYWQTGHSYLLFHSNWLNGPSFAKGYCLQSVTSIVQTLLVAQCIDHILISDYLVIILLVIIFAIVVVWIILIVIWHHWYPHP